MRGTDLAHPALMRSEPVLSRWFAALHLIIVSALVFAELGGFIERIVPRFSLPPTAETVVAAASPGSGAAPAVLDGVKFTPEQREGETVGLRLNGVDEQGLFAKLGLREGDRLDSVGGYRVTSMNEMLALYARLRALDVLKLLIERDGHPMTITVRLR
jgi:type II secretory pathway component PulC